MFASGSLFHVLCVCVFVFLVLVFAVCLCVVCCYLLGVCFPCGAFVFLCLCFVCFVVRRSLFVAFLSPARLLCSCVLSRVLCLGVGWLFVVVCSRVFPVLVFYVFCVRLPPRTPRTLRHSGVESLQGSYECLSR